MNRKQRRARASGDRSGGGRDARHLAGMAEEARRRHEAGCREAAIVIIGEGMALRSRDVDGLNRLAQVALAMGLLGEAEHLASEALAVMPNGSSQRVLGELFQARGDLDAAISAFKSALEFQPKHARTHANLALVLIDQQRWAEAEQCCRIAIAASPSLAEAYGNLGTTLFFQGRIEEAVAAFEQAVACRPDYADAHANLGSAQKVLGHTAAAAVAFDRAIELAPDDVDAHVGRAEIHFADGQFGHAVVCFARALAYRPNHPPLREALVGALVAAGYDHIGKGSPATARKCFCQALEYDPEQAVAHAGLGQIETDVGQFSDALVAFRRALDIDSTNAAIWTNYGNALAKFGDVEDALAAYRTSLELCPTNPDAFSNILFVSHYSSTVSDDDLTEIALRFGRTFARPPTATRGIRDPNKRLRVGYVSADFGLHPVGFFLNRVLAAHDRRGFEIICYATGSAQDEMTASLRAKVDAWHSILGRSDDAAARMIVEHEIDILVDLAGHTGGNRLLLFAAKPAPVQVSWLGYFATTGLNTIDYILLDAVSAPPGAEASFREAVVRLPFSRFCLDPPPAPEPVAPPCIASGQITFGSFNNVAKLGPDVIATWSRVLEAVPGSRLFLKYFALRDADVRDRVTAAFAAGGIGADRLMFEGPSSHYELMECYGRVDIALDPFPFNGGMTSCDALWMGVPVVTHPGSRPASRQTLCFLDLLDLGTLAANSLDDYVRRAASLAADPQRLAWLRRTLRPRIAASPLCDGRLFTEGLEEAFRKMWRRHCQGGAAESFDVDAARAKAMGRLAEPSGQGEP